MVFAPEKLEALGLADPEVEVTLGAEAELELWKARRETCSDASLRTPHSSKVCCRSSSDGFRSQRRCDETFSPNEADCLRRWPNARLGHLPSSLVRVTDGSEAH